MRQLAAYWQLGPRTAVVQLIAPSQWWLHSNTSQEMVAETGSSFSSRLLHGITTGFTEKLSADFVPTELMYM